MIRNLCNEVAKSRTTCVSRNLYRANSTKSHNLVYNRDTGIVSSTSDDASSSLQPLYQSVIGIEIHAQLCVPTKLFSSAPTKHHADFTPAPNKSASPHDIAFPGTLPLLSKSSVQLALISAAALNCEIQHTSRFERKHYTYADLPFGYQVTQQRWPLAKEGLLTCRRYNPPAPKKKAEKSSRGGRINTDYLQESDETNSPPSHENSAEPSKFFDVGIDRIQIEQDTGKTTAVPSGSNTQYLIDFNRAGSTLIEIVFRPQIHSAHEAASVVSTLQSLLKYLDTCDGKMEEGSLRCDLNVSICPISPTDNDCNELLEDDNPFQAYLPKGVGHRVEVKNLNSLKQIIQSAEYEALRQTQQILEGSPTGRETRTFDPKSGNTVKIRDKGGSVDYRFMPEPDLPPVRLNRNILGTHNLDDFLENNLPELPEAATSRLMEHYGISEASSLIITSDRPAISFYEASVALCMQELELDGDNLNDLETVSTTVANWLCNDLFALIKESATSKKDDKEQKNDETTTDGALNHPISVRYSNVDATRLGSLLSLILKETVSTTQGKKLLSVMYNEDLTSLPLDIADANGWKLISDPNVLKSLCKDVILNPQNGKQFEQYKQGGKHVRKMIKFFTGMIMAESRGNAHPKLMAKALQDVLEDLAPGVEE